MRYLLISLGILIIHYVLDTVILDKLAEYFQPPDDADAESAEPEEKR